MPKLPISWWVRPPPSYVITLVGHDQRVPTVITLFKKYANLKLLPYYGINGNTLYKPYQKHVLTPGERGLRDTMTAFFKMVLRYGDKEVFLFEDDAIPHLNFTALFNRLPSRCRQADILLLGATLFRDEQNPWPNRSCFDANKLTYGSFALFVKKSAFAPIIDWLAKGRQKPFDFVYRYLQKKGLYVRVAYPPFLVIPDVSHPSLVDKYRPIDQDSVNERAQFHDWSLDNYPMSVIPV